MSHSHCLITFFFLLLSLPALSQDGEPRGILWASPAEILKLRGIYAARNRALNTVKKHKVVRQFVKVSDSPDGDTPVVNLLFRNPSVLFFIDDSGAKWPVTKTSIVNADWLKCGNCSKASEDFDNSIEIYSVTPEGSAYFLVYLEGRAMPVHIMATSSSLNPVYHAVTDISIDDLRSQESAHYPPMALSDGAAPDQDLSNALANVSPKDSVEVKSSSDQFKIWRQGDSLIVRTKMNITSPRSKRKQINSSGYIASRLVEPAVSRILALTPDGKVVRVKVFLDE